MLKTTERLLMAVLAGMLCVGLVGCGQETETPEVTTPETQETQTPPTGTTDDTDATDGSASTDGEALARQKCTMCHTYDRVEQASKSAAEWEETIERMVGLGLAVSADERAAITEYLVDRDN